MEKLEFSSQERKSNQSVHVHITGISDRLPFQDLRVRVRHLEYAQLLPLTPQLSRAYIQHPGPVRVGELAPIPFHEPIIKTRPCSLHGVGQPVLHSEQLACATS